MSWSVNCDKERKNEAKQRKQEGSKRERKREVKEPISEPVVPSLYRIVTVNNKLQQSLLLN